MIRHGGQPVRDPASAEPQIQLPVTHKFLRNFTELQTRAIVSRFGGRRKVRTAKGSPSRESGTFRQHEKEKVPQKITTPPRGETVKM